MISKSKREKTIGSWIFIPDLPHTDETGNSCKTGMVQKGNRDKLERAQGWPQSQIKVT